MASEFAPTESLIPQERPNTPEFQAQVERSQLESQVWRGNLVNELGQIRIRSEVSSGTWRRYFSHYLSARKFDPAWTEQYLPETISEDTIRSLQIDRENIMGTLTQSTTKLYNHVISPWENIESGEVEGFLWFFFSTDEGTWAHFHWGSWYYQAKEFNHKIALLPESMWILPIDISADTLGKSISQWYEDLEAEFLNFSAFDDYVLQYAESIGMESIPGKNTKEYLDLCWKALSSIEYRFRDYQEARNVFYALPEDIQTEIDYDVEQALEKISSIRRDCLKVLLENDTESGYRGIQFDWNLSRSEIQIAQFWLEQADTISVLNQAMASLLVSEQWYITPKTISEADGILNFLLRHPNKQIWIIISNEVERYTSSLWIRNSLDGDFWDQTLIMVATYQYKKYWADYAKVTGKLDKETMLSLAAEAKASLEK